MPFNQSLRSRMLLYLVLILLIFSGIAYWSTGRLLAHSQHNHEQRFAEADLRRLQTLLHSQQQNLLHTLLDYSRWDDTLSFLDTRSSAYLKNNYTRDSLDNLGIDLVLFLSTDLQVLEGLQLQDGRLQTVTTQNPLWQQLKPILAQRSQDELNEGIKLVLWAEGTAVQLAIGPITDSDQSQPTAGWLVFARHLDAPRVQRLQSESGVAFSLQANGSPLPDTEDGAQIVASDLLKDSLGQSDVRLLISRPLAAQSHLALAERLQLGNSLLILFLATLSVALLLEHLVLRRLSRLQRVAHLHQPAPGERPAGDELDQLSRSLHSTLNELKHAHRDLYAEVRRDALTGLGNRKAFDETLALFQALQQRHDNMRTTVYLFDLDNFKLVNDCLGHEAGDNVLRQTAERIRGMIRASDCAIRLGGDEFAILSISECDELGMQTFAERLLEAIRQPLLIDSIRMTLSASMGIADSKAGMSQDQLLRNADIAMYEAKSLSKGSFAFFSAQMHEQVRERMSIEQDLRAALANGQLEVWFQPIVDPNGRPLMLEALARWPRNGALFPPDRFIPVAEESGLIDELGMYIARNAINALPRLQVVQPGLEISINLSVKQMLQDDLATQLCTLVDSAQVSRRLVHFELTESAFAEHQERLEQQLLNLAREGFDLHMDDFGTGYSSLQRLQSLPMSALKLDKSFTRQIGQGDERIARVILSLGEQLQMQVIAEGVETETERRRLQELGCPLMQGFLFAKPMPEQELINWLRLQSASPAPATGFSHAS